MGFPCTSNVIIGSDGRFFFRSSTGTWTNTSQKWGNTESWLKSTPPNREVSVCQNFKLVSTKTTLLPVPGPPYSSRHQGKICLVKYPFLHFLLNTISRDGVLRWQHRQSREQIYILHLKNEPLKHPRTFILSDPRYYQDKEHDKIPRKIHSKSYPVGKKRKPFESFTNIKSSSPGPQLGN